MPAKMNGLLSSLRLVWADVMPLSRGMSFATQDFLEDRVSELEQETTGCACSWRSGRAGRSKTTTGQVAASESPWAGAGAAHPSRQSSARSFCFS